MHTLTNLGKVSPLFSQIFIIYIQSISHFNAEVQKQSDCFIGRFLHDEQPPRCSAMGPENSVTDRG